jgi:2-polyprenyl-3-methyl-5-hydroxy-6-metoxy-1,4-benzoquinol methylase
MESSGDLSLAGRHDPAVDRRDAVVCLFCGVNDTTLYSRAKSRYDERMFDVVRCRHCGLVYTNPRIADKPFEIEHQQRPPRCEDDEKRGAAQLQLRRLERFCRPGRLLDFGCGEGVLVHQALQRGWDAYGLELNRYLVNAANKHWGDNRLWFETLDSVVERQRASFDAVISTQVFEHLSNPVDVLRKVGALIKPGGVVLIDVPNLECKEERRRRGASLDPTAHLYYFTSATLIRLMQEADLSVVSCRAAPNNYGLYRRVFERIAGPNLPVVLSDVTDRLPLPGIGQGVFAVGRVRGAGQ